MAGEGRLLILAFNAVAAVLSLTPVPGSEDLFTWTTVPDASARMLASGT